ELTMNICERSGYTISVEIKQDGSIEFLKHRENKTDDFDRNQVSRPSNRLIVEKKDVKDFLRVIHAEDKKDHEEMMSAIKEKFNKIKNFKEIKMFFEDMEIPYQVTNWEAFYES
ncbi:MAG: hypothetical protein IH571_04480, partial [Acholeplasmataceae bacterium]|nr:hypothetical protein [Acholeplasmataceae bacterium]